ncbi:MAG: DUF6531 domain-containing protein, partial [Spirochaetota bacterium]
MKSAAIRFWLIVGVLLLAATAAFAGSASVPLNDYADFRASLIARGCEITSEYPEFGYFIVEYECPSDDDDGDNDDGDDDADDLEDRLQARIDALTADLDSAADDEARASIEEELSEAIALRDRLAASRAEADELGAAAENLVEGLKAAERLHRAQADVERLLSEETAKVGDPVRIAMGAFVHEESDFSVRVASLEVNLRRSYVSDSSISGSFGPGWRCSCDTRVVRAQRPGAAEIVASTRNWLRDVEELYADLLEAYETTLGSPDAGERGEAEQALENLQPMLAYAQQLVARAVSLSSDARGTSLSGKALALETDVRSYRDGIVSLQSGLGDAIDELRSLRPRLVEIASIEIPRITAIVAEEENKLRHSEQSASANRFSAFAQTPDSYLFTGLGNITLIDESGTPLRFTLNTSPI